MPADVDNYSSTVSCEASGSSSGNHAPQPPPPPQNSAVKRKRNQAGNPDPEAVVVALSPKTLLATNRFVCEICNKGFQRDQNLQLHRRGHNLPWKLRQRADKEVTKKVYVCPEPTCVHHNPTRALGDLTGIKKHFCRKHGEKKWKCDKCSKKYAVQSDYKAHLKVCGTREYKCDCGTVFSRKDSFIGHRPFCDALAEESVKAQTKSPKQPSGSRKSEPEPKAQPASSTDPTPPPSPPPAPFRPPAAAVEVVTETEEAPPPTSNVNSTVVSNQSPELPENQSPLSEDMSAVKILEDPPALTCIKANATSTTSGNTGIRSTVFAGLFATSSVSGRLEPPRPSYYGDIMRAMPEPSVNLAPSSSIEPILCLSTSHQPSLFGAAGQECQSYVPPTQPAMSATALLQKAAEMGATASNGSLICGLGLVSSSSSPIQHDYLQWGQRQAEAENSSNSVALRLGLPNDGGAGLNELIMATPSVFAPNKPTLDFLGLGMAAGGSPSSGLSALLTSIGGGLDLATAATPYGSGDFTGKDVGSSS